MLVKKNKPNITMFLAKPDKTIIGKLKYTTNRSLTEKSDEVDELTFTLPYKITVDGKTIRNPHIDAIKDKFLVKTLFKGKVKWFLINGIKKSSSDTDDLEVRCFLLPYQLKYNLVLDYEVTGYNCKMVSDDILKDTGWTTGYVNPEFNLKYRRFEISSQSKLTTIYEIEETFDAVVIFDTVEQTVNYYKEEEVSNYKGFSIGYGKYIQNIEEDLESDEVVTRLYVTGSDGITINSVNPTGQSYIDDFSYFLYPFEMDKEGNVIKHSDYMSDELSKGLVTYNKTISDNKDNFSNLLSEKRDLQIERTGHENELKDKESELQIILDAIVIAKKTRQSTSQLTKDRDNKNKEISSLKDTIKNINDAIEQIDIEIESLRQNMRMDSFLSNKELIELSRFIQAEEWSDDNMFDANDLYEAGLKQLSEVNKPAINITTSLVNFMQMISEKHNWDRFDVWDIVRIDHKKLDMDIKVPITEINYQFDGEEIGVTVSDSKKAKNIVEEVRDLFYTVGQLNADYNKRKLDWPKIAYNFNLRNDRIEELPIEPTNTVISHKENDDGSVNLELDWNYPEYNDTKKNEHNIDGFLIYMYFDESEEPYQFGAKMGQETIVDVSLYTSSYVFPSVPSNLYYTVGIRAYRRVDDDIDLDGILLSEIVTFEKQESGIQTFSTSATSQANKDNYSPPSPYQPRTDVDFKGSINGIRIKSDVEAPKNPRKDDIWIDLKDFKIKIWDGNKWSGDVQVEDIKNKLESNEDKIDGIESDLQNRLEESKKELEKAMEEVDEEVKRIEEQVIPEVEKAVEASHIPESDMPPDEIPLSNLWWDASHYPARLMRWDMDLADWTTLAPTEEEIEKIMEKMSESAVVESRRYSKLEIIKTRNKINDRIDEEIGDVLQKAQELEELGEQLQQIANDTQEYIDNLMEEIEGWGDLAEIVDSHSSHIEQTDSVLRQTVGRVTVNEDRIEEAETQIEHNADEIALRATKTAVEHIEGEIQSVTEDVSSLSVRADAIESEVSRVETELDGRIGTAESNIIQTADNINQRITNFEAEYDSDKTDILSNIERNETEINQLSDEINLRVTKDEWENTNDDFDARITSAEGTLTVHSDAISQMVTQSQLTNYVDYSTYNNKVASLETSLTGITGRVSDVEVEIDSVTSDITSATARIGTLELTTSNITTTVESLETDLGVANQAISRIDQTATGIVQTVSRVETELNELEIGGRNLLVRHNEEVGKYIGVDGDINSSSTYSHHAFNNYYVPIEPGQILTFSKESISSGDKYWRWRWFDENKNYMDRSANSSNEFQWTVPSSAYYLQASYPMDAYPKIEKGNKATDWTPAPEDMDARMTATESRIELLPDEINLAVSEGIGGLEIGGRNLLTGTSGSYQAINHSTYYATVAIVNIADVGLKVGDTVTFSVYIKSRGSYGGLARFRWHNSAGDNHANTMGSQINAGEEGRITVTDTVPANTTSVRLVINNIPSGTTYTSDIKEAKFERGSKATDWTPAPEDQVDKTNVLSSINLSTEGVKIQGSKIDIDGLATFSGVTSETNLLAGRTSSGTTSTSVATNGSKNVGSTYVSFGSGNRSDSGSEGSYLQYDLGREYRIQESRVYFFSGDDRYYWYKIKYSKNGSDWFYAVGNGNSNGWKRSIPRTVSGNTVQNPTVDTFSLPISARYVRLYGNGNSTNSGNHIYEWELFSTSQTMIHGGSIVTNTITANQLNINNIFGNSAVIAKIQADSIATANLDASKITTGEMSGARIQAGTLSATKITSGTLDASKVTVSNLSASSITTGTLNGNNVNVTNLSASNIKSGTLSAARIGAESITASKLNIAEIFGNSAVIGSVQIGNAVTTIGQDGITVKDGNFLLEESESGDKYSVVVKRNLVSDSSFESIRRDPNRWNQNRWANKFADGTYPWSEEGSPEISIPFSEGEGTGAIFGLKALLVNSTNGVSQDIAVEPSTTYTVSFYTKRGRHSTVRGATRIYIDQYNVVYEQSFDKVGSSYSPSFSAPPANKTVRHSYTFTTHSQANLVRLRLNSTSSTNWAMIDGVQLVEGSYMTPYEPEEGLSQLMNGGVTAPNLGATNLDVMRNLFVNTSGTSRTVSFPSGHMISEGSSSGDWNFYGNRASGQNPFTIRTHANRSSYRNDLWVEPDGRVFMGEMWDNTSSNSAQARIGRPSSSEPRRATLYRVTSSRRYKLLEEELKIDPYKILELKPKSWYDKNSIERYAEELSKKAQGKEFNADIEQNSLSRVAGLISEDLVDVGLGMFVEKGENGELEGIQYDRVWTLLIPITRDIKAKCDEQEEEILNLKHKNRIKSSQIQQLKQRIEQLEDLVL